MTLITFASLTVDFELVSCKRVTLQVDEGICNRTYHFLKQSR